MKNNNYICDFAFEAYQNKNDNDVYSDFKRKKDLGIYHLEVLKKNERIGKEKGNYYALEMKSFETFEDYSLLIEEIRKIIVKLVKLKKVKKNPFVLVVGLGNDDYVPDALGPRVIKKMNATSHLLGFKDVKIDTKVSCIIPGVMALTGLESAEIISSLVDQFKINLIIAIDSLATTNIQRLYRVIQITDTGIAPGTGIKNYRKELNEKHLGIPVIGIGVSTVVASHSIVNQVLKSLSEDGVKISEKSYKKILKEMNSNLILTTKEIDNNIQVLTSLIAEGINKALNPHLIP